MKTYPIHILEGWFDDANLSETGYAQILTTETPIRTEHFTPRQLMKFLRTKADGKWYGPTHKQLVHLLDGGMNAVQIKHRDGQTSFVSLIELKQLPQYLGSIPAEGVLQ